MSFLDYYNSVVSQPDLTICKKFPLTVPQVDGVKFLLSHIASILCFQTGLGKTYTVSTALKYLMDFNENIAFHIFMPYSAFKIFRKELTEKMNLKYNEYSTESLIEIDNVRVFLYSLTSMKTYKYAVMENCKKFGNNVFIFDELHKIQDSKTQLAKFFRGYSDKDILDLKKEYEKDKLTLSFEEEFILRTSLLNKAWAIWGLTATPLLNHIEGLYYCIDFVKPGILGNFYSFRSRYCDVTEFEIKNPKYHLIDGKPPANIKEKIKIKNITGIKKEMLEPFKKILDSIVLIRAKNYDIDISYHKTGMTPLQIKYYNKASMGLLDLERTQYSTRLIDLQKIVDNSYPDMVIQPIFKEKLLLDTLIDIFNRNESALIYVEYHDTFKRLKKVLKSSNIGISNLFEISGKIDFATRQTIESSIVPRSAVLTTSAGSFSLNLQRANNVIFYSIPFSIGTFIQMVGRITRMDSTYKKFYVHLLEVEGSIDTYKCALLEDNMSCIRKLFGEQNSIDLAERDFDAMDLKKMRSYFLWTSRGVKNRLSVNNIVDDLKLF